MVYRMTRARLIELNYCSAFMLLTCSFSLQLHPCIRRADLPPDSFYLMVMYAEMKNANDRTQKLFYLAAIVLFGVISLFLVCSIGGALVLLWGPPAKIHSIKGPDSTGFATHVFVTAPTILGIVSNPAKEDVWGETDVI